MTLNTDFEDLLNEGQPIEDAFDQPSRDCVLDLLYKPGCALERGKFVAHVDPVLMQLLYGRTDPISAFNLEVTKKWDDIHGELDERGFVQHRREWFRKLCATCEKVHSSFHNPLPFMPIGTFWDDVLILSRAKPYHARDEVEYYLFWWGNSSGRSNGFGRLHHSHLEEMEKILISGFEEWVTWILQYRITFTDEEVKRANKLSSGERLDKVYAYTAYEIPLSTVKLLTT